MSIVFLLAMQIPILPFTNAVTYSKWCWSLENSGKSQGFGDIKSPKLQTTRETFSLMTLLDGLVLVKTLSEVFRFDEEALCAA